MKQYRYDGIKLLVFLLWAGMMMGCGQDTATEPALTDGKVPVVVDLGGIYSPLSSRATHPDLKDDMIKNLPDGSTLRLIMWNEDTGIQQADASGLTYVVQTPEGGAQSLYPCEVASDGSLVEGSVKMQPYYLAAGAEFNCMAISPAKLPTYEDGKLWVTVKNKETFLATNNTWSQTQFTTVKVPQSVTEPAVIKLNPLMHTTACIKVTVNNYHNATNDAGVEEEVIHDKVVELLPSSPALEIDRVPTESTVHNLAIGENIEERMGNIELYNRIDIPANKCKVDETLTDGRIAYSCETTVLPMDARPTPLIIRINVMVNEAPMQFQYQVNERFEAGYMYHYKATIHLTENQIYIAAWQDTSWLYAAKPKNQ